MLAKPNGPVTPSPPSSGPEGPRGCSGGPRSRLLGETALTREPNVLAKSARAVAHAPKPDGQMGFEQFQIGAYQPTAAASGVAAD
jgi:hypothetical protein